MTTPHAPSLVGDRSQRQAWDPAWIPRCPGCAPADVRPHNCTGRVDGHGRCCCRECR